MFIDRVKKNGAVDCEDLGLETVNSFDISVRLGFLSDLFGGGVTAMNITIPHIPNVKPLSPKYSYDATDPKGARKTNVGNLLGSEVEVL